MKRNIRQKKRGDRRNTYRFPLKHFLLVNDLLELVECLSERWIDALDVAALQRVILAKQPLVESRTEWEVELQIQKGSMPRDSNRR